METVNKLIKRMIMVLLLIVLIIILHGIYSLSKDTSNKVDKLQYEVDSIKANTEGLIVVDGRYFDEDDWSQRLSD